MKEKEAIRRCQAGDVTALEVLFQLHHHAVLRTAYGIVRRHDLAEDVSRQVFVELFASIKRYDLRRPFPPWLQRIAVNLSLDELRRRGSRNVLIEVGRDPQSSTYSGQATQESEPGASIRNALGALEPEHRAAIVLRYYHGFGEAEMAVTLHCRCKTVKSRLRSAMRRLREVLAAEGATSSNEHEIEAALAEELDEVAPRGDLWSTVQAELDRTQSKPQRRWLVPALGSLGMSLVIAWLVLSQPWQSGAGSTGATVAIQPPTPVFAPTAAVAVHPQLAPPPAPSSAMADALQAGPAFAEPLVAPSATPLPAPMPTRGPQVSAPRVVETVVVEKAVVVATSAPVASAPPGPPTALPATLAVSPAPIPTPTAAEPNYLDSTSFENYGVNPFVSAGEQPFSTFAMDVDTASYTIARGYLRSGQIPPVDAVRVEEFVNYFDQGYPDAGDVFEIFVDGARSPFHSDGRYLMRVGIEGMDITVEDRRDAVITFVIDTSGSMREEDRLELVKRGLNILVDNLRPRDLVGIVEYGSAARALLAPTMDKAAVKAVVNVLLPNGSTNAAQGLQFGYLMASDAYQEGKINRVVLVSDGVANVGEADPLRLLEDIKASSRDGITLSAIGVGRANYNDVLMEKLADHGDGNYAYVDTDEEADALFGDGLTGLLEVIASDAKAQVEFEPAAVAMYRLVGYENRGLSAEQFRDDAIDAGEVGAGHTVTAIYELLLMPEATGRLGAVRVRYADPDSGEVREIERRVTVDELGVRFEDSQGRFRFTASVMTFAEILRQSPWAADVSLSAVIDVAEAAVRSFDATERDLNFIEIAKLALELGVTGYAESGE